MKKSLLLSLAMAVSCSTAFAADVVPMKIEKKGDVKVQAVKQYAKQQVSKADLAAKVKFSGVKSPKFSTQSKSAILKAAAAGDVSYHRPFGYFYFGLDENSGYLGTEQGPMTVYLGPETSSTWINTSSQSLTNFSWEYMDPASTTEAQYLTSTDINLTAPDYQYYTFCPAPTLTSDNITYGEGSYMQLGGNGSWDFADGSTGYYYGYNMLFNGVLAGYGLSNDPENGIAAQLKSYGFSAASLDAFGTLYYAPEKPYALQNVDVFAYIENPSASAAYTCNIYSIDPESGEMNKISTSTLDVADAKLLNSDGTLGLYSLVFPTQVYDDMMGWYEFPITVDTAIYVQIELGDPETNGVFVPWFNTGVVTTNAYADEFFNSEEAEHSFEYTSYFEYSGTVNGNSGSSMLPTSYWTCFYTDNTRENVQWPADMAMGLDVIYTIVDCDDPVYLAPDAGGSKDFDVLVWYTEGAWSVAEEDAGTMPSWLQWSGSTNVETGEAKFTVTVDPLPAGMTERSTNLTLTIPGASKTFWIGQGAASVDGVTVSDTSVKVVNGDFEVASSDATAVDVYNVAGQKVASATLDGNATVPAQDLAKGMYILKFNNNATVKVAK